jgi:hypothetical protein
MIALTTGRATLGVKKDALKRRLPETAFYLFDERRFYEYAERNRDLMKKGLRRDSTSHIA